MSKKIALVTGASRGIGLVIAQLLGQQGYMVIGTATTKKGAETFHQKCQSYHFESVGLVCDISNKESVYALKTHINESIGAPRVVINNAGIVCDQLSARMQDEEWEKVINVNLSGTFYITKSFVRLMIHNRFGRIINISSIIGFTGQMGQANYAAAKAGLTGMTKSMARELASFNITINNIAPGFIETDMTNQLSEDIKNNIKAQIPMKRFGTSKDVANACLFLASEQASYITGTTIHVNGGLYMN